MALLSPQQLQATGTEVTYAAAAGGGDTVDPGQGDRIVLHVKNGDAADKTVTLVVPGTSYGQANPDIPIVVTAAEERFIKVPRQIANSDGLVDITYSAVTSLTIAALRT